MLRDSSERIKKERKWKKNREETANFSHTFHFRVFSTKSESLEQSAETPIGRNNKER